MNVQSKLVLKRNSVHVLRVSTVRLHLPTHHPGPPGIVKETRRDKRHQTVVVHKVSSAVNRRDYSIQIFL